MMEAIALNLSLAFLGLSMFVFPSMMSLVLHVRTRNQRHFSHVVRPLMHSIVLVFRLALLLGAAWTFHLYIKMPDPTAYGVLAITYGAIFLVCALIVGFSKDRRLFINADTGLITWKRWSRPFAKTKSPAYIDSVRQLEYTTGDLDLLGIEELRERYTVNHNGNNTIRGDYPKEVIRKLVERFNRYHEMFFQHDSPGRREQRRLFKQNYEHALSPARSMARDIARDESENAEREAAEEAQKAARLEEKKRRDVARKFQ